MLDSNPPEDQAALYVLGGLHPAARREFKARLAESAELRETVRALEEGAVAVALASPLRRPPEKLWPRIDAAVGEEAKRGKIIPAFGTAWWWSGWAAAAACLAGWILYGLFVNQRNTGRAPEVVVSETHAPADGSNSPETAERTFKPAEPSTPEASLAQRANQSRTQELVAMRSNILELEDHVARLSQSVTEQQAMLGETNRLRFFQLASGSNGSAPVSVAALSPGLQRALSLAVARELGWLSPDQIAGLTSPAAGANRTGVDFVDLRAGTNATFNPSRKLPETETSTDTAETSPPSTNTFSSSLPAFTSGTDTIVAIDTNTVPPGGLITFVSDSVATFSSLMGSNPLVLTLPGSANGGNLLFSSAGQVTGTQFFIPGTNHP